MFCWPCISIYLCNEKQLYALFIRCLFRQSTSTCFGHICRPSSRGILYIYNNWHVLCSLARPTDSQLKTQHVPIVVYRVSQEECARFRESVPYIKVYRYNPKHLCPKLNGYIYNGQSKVWSSCGSTHCTCQLTILSISLLKCGVIWRQFSSR